VTPAGPRCRFRPSAFVSHFAPPLLPSFPTRRSSDLKRRNASGPAEGTMRWSLAHVLDAAAPHLDVWLAAPRALTRARSLLASLPDRKSTRLNSRSHLNLVCRLLPEKKTSSASTRHR